MVKAAARASAFIEFPAVLARACQKRMDFWPREHVIVSLHVWRP